MIDMDKEEIVRVFLKNGFQISKNALDLVSKDPETIISKLKKITPRPFIITEEHVKKVLEKTLIKPVEVRVTREYSFDKKPIHVSDYIKGISSRYEKIRSLLLKQMKPKKLVSINKITPRTTNFSIIGMVREKSDSSILIEDLTGEMILHFDENMKKKLEKVLLDDVVGIECKRIREKYNVKKIFYPDIPSSRKIGKTEDEIQIAVVSAVQDLTKSKQKKLMDRLIATENLSALFLFSDFTESIINKSFKFNLIHIPSKPNPKLFQLDEIKILAIPKSFFEEFFESVSAPEVFVSILKRRELFTQVSPPLHAHKNFILHEIPDIIISDFDGSFFQNYKGTTIISNSNPQKVFFINLKSREVHEVLI